jgi:hypothetical protein
MKLDESLAVALTSPQPACWALAQQWIVGLDAAAD